ncbi:transmembrane protein NRF-6 [Pelomyxa schiedti]|nr:transmembrane protein NRF-6 [Pelomyxa schiedti]
MAGWAGPRSSLLMGVFSCSLVIVLMMAPMLAESQETVPDAQAGSNKTECEKAVRGMLLGTTPEGLEMISHSGRRVNDYGSYSDCISLDLAHYCVVKFHLLIVATNDTTNATGIPRSWGLCLPINCTNKDIPDVFPTIATKMDPYVENRIADPVGHFSDENEWGGWTTGAEATLALLCSFVLIAICCTFVTKIYDHVEANAKTDFRDEPFEQYTDPEKVPLHGIQSAPPRNMGPKPMWYQILSCFSLARTCNSLFRVESRSEDFIGELDAIRFFSMCWVVLGHTLMFGLGGGFENGLYVLRNVLPRWTFMVVWGSEFAVDTFFFMSGLVVAWKLYPCLQKRPTVLSGVMFVVLRYIRLTALLGVVILLELYVLPLVIEGPLAFSYIPENDQCRKYWWVTLLYIQNVYPSPNNSSGCVAVSWYLANDMQFYLILAPIVISVVAWSPKIGWPWMIIVWASSVITAGSIVGANDITVTSNTSGINTYSAPWMRWQPYVLGMMLAIGFKQLEKYKRLITLKMTWWMAGLSFACGTTLLLLIIFVSYPERQDETWNQAQNIIWFALNRTGWTLGLVFLLIPCYYGHGGMLSGLLAHTFFQPLSRLTYGIYLTHTLWITYEAYSRWWPYLYSDVIVVTSFLSTLVIGGLFSTTSWIILEKPVGNLLALLTGVLQPSPKKKA